MGACALCLGSQSPNTSPRNAASTPSPTYFVAELPRIVREYEACIALIKPKEDKESILAMSASTLDRAFKGLPRIKPFAVKSNRRSDLNRPILDAIECKSGEETMACDIRPGDTQIDTVAHCGGDRRGNFFWTLTQTDRNTQWTEITPTWNRGMHNTVEALKERYEQLNGIQLYQQVVRRLKRILRRQECWRDQQRQTQKLILEARLADFAPFNASINSFIFNH